MGDEQKLKDKIDELARSNNFELRISVAENKIKNYVPFIRAYLIEKNSHLRYEPMLGFDYKSKGGISYLYIRKTRAFSELEQSLGRNIKRLEFQQAKVAYLKKKLSEFYVNARE